MSINREKKNQIRLYLLEKIAHRQTSVVSKTAQTFGVTQATVYKYLDSMVEEGIVSKIKRGEYALISTSDTFVIKREDPVFDSEDAIYVRFIRPLIESLPQNVKGIWAYLCGEMLNNVIDHSHAERLSITVTHDFMNTTIQLADDGIGIFEKIRVFLGLNSNEEAVGELFKGKLTTDEKHHSGEGIFFSSRLADEFVIFSSGLVFTHNRFDNDALLREMPGKGTVVRMTLSNFSKKEAKDVFDQYADADSAFSRTQIPLRQYFETAPVSRSQAKRLCSRLDKFREVVLDFSDMNWIGQGFAHQLFVVFQNDHPDIKLVPINMSDDVEKMYHHVIG